MYAYAAFSAFMTADQARAAVAQWALFHVEQAARLTLI